MKNKKLQNAIIIVGTLLGILIAFFLKPPAALVSSAEAAGSTGKNAMIVLGTVVCAVFWWVSTKVPDWCVGIGMLCVWTVTKCCSFQTAFSQFGGTSVWLIIGAFIIAVAVVKTGALRRISLSLMSIFKPTFAGQVLSMLTMGAVISPLIPSATAKSVLGVNMAVSTGKAMKYPEYSKGGTGLFVAAWIGTAILAPCFLSASAFSYIIIDVANADISWLKWFAAMLPWGVIIVAGMFFAIMKLYKPETEEIFTKDYIKGELKAMGKISRREIISLTILFLCLIGWILESVIGVSASIVALIGALFCFGIGILEPKDLSTSVPWALILFTAAVMQMGSMFSYVGLSGWIGELITPLFGSIKNVYLLVAVIIILVCVVRFALSSQAAVITLFITILYPIVSALGVSPLILGLLAFTAGQIWFMPYQNTTYVAALGAGEGYVRHSDISKSCIVYCVISLVASLVSVPYWDLIGLI